MRGRNTRVFCILIGMIATGFLTSGCVSSTLETAKPEVEAKQPSYDPIARANAVAEMRAKAANVSGKKTNAFQTTESINTPLTTGEANLKIQELNASSSTLAEQITDEELDNKQRSIEEMRVRAQSHYLDALGEIEN